MTQITYLDEYRRTHPPALICLQHGLACAVAWQKLWLMVICGRPIK